jgi:hypothetical protein
VLQAIRGWAAADLRAWPREHRKVRLVLVLGGLEAASFGWVAVALLGVPANVPSTKVRLEAGSSLWFALGLLVVLLLSGAPLAFYVRYVRTLPASLVTGIALIALTVYAFGFMVTSTSDTAGLAILGPFFLNYFVFAGGVGLDRLLRRFDGARTPTF